MIAVITGDIINSREISIEWLDTLKRALSGLTKVNLKWEIYRGDSFQIELDVEDALLNAIYIKACIKTLKNADVRMGIGIGTWDKSGKKGEKATIKLYVDGKEVKSTTVTTDDDGDITSSIIQYSGGN